MGFKEPPKTHQCHLVPGMSFFRKLSPNTGNSTTKEKNVFQSNKRKHLNLMDILSQTALILVLMDSYNFGSVDTFPACRDITYAFNY